MSTMPRQLGKYQLQQPLGRGTAGEVWKGTDLQLRRDVALKLIHTDLQSDPHFLTHFLEQGPAITALHHANLVQVHEVNIIRSPQGNETTAYLDMDYIEGQTLAEYLHFTSHRGIFPPIEQIIYLFTSLGVAIDYAHQNGIVHGNIKPGNILLHSRDTSNFIAGEPMLADTGLGQLLGGATLVGTPQYMSPEQARGEPANNRSDVYALGVLLYECCTGIQPFRDGSSVAVMMQHMNTLPTPPTLINPNIPPALSQVILRAMAKDTATRYAMASLLAAALADACSIQNHLPLSLQSGTGDTGRYAAIHPGITQNSILGVPQLPGQQSTSTKPLPVPGFPQWPAASTGKLASMPTTNFRLASEPAQLLPEEQKTLSPLDIKSSGPLARTPPPPIDPEQFSFRDRSGKLPRYQDSPTFITGIEGWNGENSVQNAPAPSINIQNSEQRQLTVPRPMSPTLQKVRMRTRAKDRPIYAIVASLLILLIVVSCVIAANVSGLFRGAVASGNQSGQVFFQDDALGHNDVLRMDLKNVAPPAAGKSYFGWLQDTTKKTYPLGPLMLTGGNATLLYAGNAQHTNLLPMVQDIFITLENTNPQPATPSQQKVYQAMFDTDSFAAIKSLLTKNASFPQDASVVSGMFETIKSMNDKAGSIADSVGNTGDTNLARRQATRVIEMLEGTAYAQSSGDLPPQYPSQLPTKIGLLSTPHQTGYLDTLSGQLDQVAKTTNDQLVLQHVQNARYAVSDLKDWLQKIHDDTVKILQAKDLKNNGTIISIALQLKQTAADAYTGHTIPPNASPLPIAGSAGAAQAYTECQYMATLNLQQLHS